MKRFFNASIIILLAITMYACGKSENKMVDDIPENKTPTKTVDSTTENKTIINTLELADPDAKYVGNYEKDEIYSKILKIENCTDPDKLVAMLKDVYGSDFVYTKLKYDDKNKIYNFPDKPNLPIFCTIQGAYKIRKDLFAKADVYFVYQEFDDGEGKIVSEEPTFIIDEYGSYLVDKYEYFTGESTGKEMINVEAWSALDLYMCQKEFIDNDEMRDHLSQYVSEMDFFKEFENLIDGNPNKEYTNNDKADNDPIENTDGYEGDSINDEKNDAYYGELEIDDLSIIQVIDSCTDPDDLCDYLFNIYNCEFKYDELNWDYDYKQLKSDNFNSYYTARLYKYQRPKIMNRYIKSDKAYLFFRAYYLEGIDEPRFSKYPLFIMDNQGSYIIFEDKNAFVNAWSVLELFAGSNGLYNGISPNEVQMYKDLIKNFKNTVEVREFFDKVREYREAYNQNQ